MLQLLLSLKRSEEEEGGGGGGLGDIIQITIDDPNDDNFIYFFSVFPSM